MEHCLRSQALRRSGWRASGSRGRSGGGAPACHRPGPAGTHGTTPASYSARGAVHQERVLQEPGARAAGPREPAARTAGGARNARSEACITELGAYNAGAEAHNAGPEPCFTEPGAYNAGAGARIPGQRDSQQGWYTGCIPARLYAWKM